MKIIRLVCVILFLVLLVIIQRFLSSGDFSDRELLVGAIVGAVITAILFLWSNAQVMKLEKKE